ncbi:MAG: 30S ribosomal protein S16 [Bdellovibrionaceae bacterium]|nr:30S ribosomal protein S16 [Pseudobdellovibrionaceae bacterium]
MIVIRLARTGYKHKAKYRVAVADSRKPLKGRFIELIGHFDPFSKNKQAFINKDKYQDWIKKGAKPSLRVKNLFSKLR